MISIITINLNNYKGLINTIKSIQSQQLILSEHIVVDGLSHDDTCSVLNLYSDVITNLISERDKGIYDAMNKGIKLSKKEYVLFLNSGDSFSDSSSLQHLTNNLGDYDLVYGDILDFGQSPEQLVNYPQKLNFEYMLCGGLPHQSTAIRKSLFDKVGLYNEKYKIISDWVFFMEALFYHNVSYKHIPHVISVYEGGGLSSRSNSTKLILWEQIDYILSRFPDYIDYYKSNSPYVKKYLRQKSRIVRWFYTFLLFKFNMVIK